jgi:signal transduction histidine kinase
MKLLTRISRSNLVISFSVFLISGIIVFQVLNHIFRKQMDESMLVEKMLIEQTINFADSVPDFRLVFGHSIEVTIFTSPLPKHQVIEDTLMYDPETGTFAHFRHLLAENTSLRNKGYSIRIYRSLSESEVLTTEILLALGLVFLSQMLTLVIANYFIARRVWIPFYRILNRLDAYRIDQAHPLTLTETNIHEFNLLSQALVSMSLKISQDYQHLKEFNENAAHEIQTPLAIIRSKLDMLIQQENLTEEQLLHISSILEALQRLSRLNQGLLLISKIENNQFIQTEEIKIDALIRKILQSFDEMITMKKIDLNVNIRSNSEVSMNAALAEIFFTNLISNAIKHNTHGGYIQVQIDQGQLTIKNSGSQITTEPNELFERFKKTGSHPDSIGLGLSIVKKISDLYRFEITYHIDNTEHQISVIFENQTLQN